ncbi:TPA: penicillin-binding protein 1C [Candidatus Sumerlaeota bacterium]|jgi:penicillin-binding protein 1C|nr:penicillin-binding protein 1C [Candidatus Sumerlaeota bacterium]
MPPEVTSPPIASRHLFRLRITRRRLLCCAIFLAVITTLLALLVWPANLQRCLHPQASGQLLDHNGKLLYAFLNNKGQWCLPRPLSEINPLLVQATLAAEDKRFYQHHGLDGIATARAFLQNLRHARVVSGASTLSMQLVKPALRPSRFSWVRKGRQIVAALAIERQANKNEILSAYLNSAPYGFNLSGCEAASRRFFGKPAQELSLSEAATLAGLPKSPTRFLPVLKNGKAPRFALKRRNYVLQRMWDEGYITYDEYQRAHREPLHARWHAFPAQAPQLALNLKPEVLRKGCVATTLDEKIQRDAQRLAQKHVRIHGEGIQNAAVLVVDIPNASVLARVGSANFYKTPGGQVDAAHAPRSPGSTLKPFTYALAMESQMLYSCEMLLDANYDYGKYKPGNYDRQHHGLISASDALSRSLNVPALAVLDRIGVEQLHAFLTRLQITTLNKPPQEYGLGLTLGNCSVPLDQLAAAYCMVGNLGEFRPLATLPSDQTRTAERFLSRGVCLQLFDMLEQPLPDEYGEGASHTVNIKPRACWKTGTSTGNKDAWAFVFNAQYLVGVWMGNSNGDPSPHLVGAQAALPLAQDVFRSLPLSNASDWPDYGDDMRSVKICATSGLPATKWCQATRTVFLPTYQYLHRVCDMHYPASVADDVVQEEPPILERWPGNAKHWDLAKITNVARIVENTAPMVSAPPNASDPSPPPVSASREEALSIYAPANDSQILLTRAPQGDRVKLSTSLDDSVTLHWYLNGKYLGASEPFKPLVLALQPGQHNLTCMTPDGLNAKTHFEVIEPTLVN